MSDLSPEDRAKVFGPFLTALGHMATVWAEYEASINVRIWELANVEKMAGTCMTSQMFGPGPRFRCLLALLELRNAPQSLLGDFNSHHAQAEKLGRQRNRYLHDPFIIDSANSTVMRMEMTADKHIRHDMISLEVEELTNLRVKITTHMDQFDKLWERVSAEVPPWPKTQFERSLGIHLHRKDPDTDASMHAHPPPTSQA